MTLIGKEKTENLKKKSVSCRQQVSAWETEMEHASWSSPHRLKKVYPRASIIGDENVVFNIYGNRYRIWVVIDYQRQIIVIKNAGTHKEYEGWKIKNKYENTTNKNKSGSRGSAQKYRKTH